VILYILLCGYPPFDAEAYPRLYELIKRGRFTFYDEDWSNISDEAKDLIKRLLTRNPLERISASEAKKHKWITKAETIDRALGEKHQRRLRRFNAVRRLRTGIATTLAICKMANIMKILIEESSEVEEENKELSVV